MEINQIAITLNGTSLVLSTILLPGGCYTGIGGIAFSFLRVALAFKDKQKDYLIQANKFLESQMKHAKTARPEKFARYLTGTSGLLVIQAMLNHVDGKSNAETFKTLEHLVETVVKSEFENEILNGRSGFLAGILIL
uniref:Uncharacterized protein n=1 Tax=Acrobeloides nanus TaxID=290746 RepID=A0A914DAP3_9BILA